MNLLAKALDRLTDRAYERAVAQQLRGLRSEAAYQRRVQLLEDYEQSLSDRFEGLSLNRVHIGGSVEGERAA